MPTLECPNCHARIAYDDPSEVPYRPFCSQRCQFVDLGKWLNEDFRVTEEIPPDELLDEEAPTKRPPLPEDW